MTIKWRITVLFLLAVVFTVLGVMFTRPAYGSGSAAYCAVKLTAGYRPVCLPGH